MTSDPDIHALVEPLRDDNVSGASELSQVAASVLRQAALRLEAGSVDEFRSRLEDVGRKVLDTQPSMAPLVTLVRRVLKAAGDPPTSEGSPTLENARLAAANAAERFIRGSEERIASVVAAAVQVLPSGGTIATLSSSGTIRTLLRSEARPRDIHVVCFESRPMAEGRGLAESLVEEGVEVTFAVDAAVDALVAGCDAVLLGTDSVGDQGIVNKIGSASLARGAKAAGVPVYVLADDTKLLPTGHPQIIDDDRPAGEVWEHAPKGVRVWNRYFEIVPWELVSGVITAAGLLSPQQVGENRPGPDEPAPG